MDILSFPALGWEFTLKRVAFSIFGLDIYWYAVIIAVGFALAFAYVMRKAKQFGLHPDRVLDVAIGGFFGGIIGARLYYVIFQWDEFKDDLTLIFNTRQGGLAIYGGIIGGLVVGYFMCRWRKVNVRAMFDLAALGFLIGQSIGRWANFVNIEAFGSNTNLPWGMTSTGIQRYLTEYATKLEAIGVTIDPAAPVHPCFLYESLWCALGFLLLHLYIKKRKFDGEIFVIYLGWYGLGRFFIEGLRTDSLLAGTLRASQVLSAILVIAAVIVLLVIRGKVKRANDPEYMPLYANTDASKVFFAEVEEKLNTPKDKSKKEKNKSADNEADVAGESEISDGEDANGLEDEKDLEDSGSLEEESDPTDKADEESEDVLGTDEEV